MYFKLGFCNFTTMMKRRNTGVAVDVKSCRGQKSGGVFSRTASFFRQRKDGNDDDSSTIDPLLADHADVEHKDTLNYALLIALYTLQGIPMGLSASIPFLIQQKMKTMATTAAAAAAAAATTTAASATAIAADAAVSSASRLSYNANAIFALCSWPFSLKLLWAPIVDSCFFKNFGRRKTWLVPVQTMAGLLMMAGANFVETQLGLDTTTSSSSSLDSINVKGVTAYFFTLYFLMATQDIAVDGWALTMLSKKNRGRGPVCNSIGQNIGYFLSFVGFLALNDPDSCEKLWRPLLRLPSNPDYGLVSLGGFIRAMGIFTVSTTLLVAIFKRETKTATATENTSLDQQQQAKLNVVDGGDDDDEMDASQIGLKETYHRLWSVCKLPSVQWLFVILFTYRLPTALSDNVKLLKSVEYGLSRTTTALLSPTIILPLGILVPIIATKVWHNSPLQQFMTAFKLRVTLVPFLDVVMLKALRQDRPSNASGLLAFWSVIVMSTALQAIVHSLQFNAQMTFFAHRVDPTIGGSYMTLLNTAANLGSTWPASFSMWLIGSLSKDPICTMDATTGVESCTGGRDPYFLIQGMFSILGCLWIFLLGKRVTILSRLPDEAWRTHTADGEMDEPYVYDEEKLLASADTEMKAKTT